MLSRKWFGQMRTYHVQIYGVRSHRPSKATCSSKGFQNPVSYTISTLRQCTVHKGVKNKGWH